MHPLRVWENVMNTMYTRCSPAVWLFLPFVILLWGGMDVAGGDTFAPGRFDQLQDDKKLSNPSFVPMQSGVKIEESATESSEEPAVKPPEMKMPAPKARTTPVVGVQPKPSLPAKGTSVESPVMQKPTGPRGERQPQFGFQPAPGLPAQGSAVDTPMGQKPGGVVPERRPQFGFQPSSEMPDQMPVGSVPERQPQFGFQPSPGMPVPGAQAEPPMPFGRDIEGMGPAGKLPSRGIDMGPGAGAKEPPSTVFAGHGHGTVSSGDCGCYGTKEGWEADIRRREANYENAKTRHFDHFASTPTIGPGINDDTPISYQVDPLRTKHPAERNSLQIAEQQYNEIPSIKAFINRCFPEEEGGAEGGTGGETEAETGAETESETEGETEGETEDGAEDGKEGEMDGEEDEEESEEGDKTEVTPGDPDGMGSEGRTDRFGIISEPDTAQPVNDGRVGGGDETEAPDRFGVVGRPETSTPSDDGRLGDRRQGGGPNVVLEFPDHLVDPPKGGMNH
jgi:hypothetical protein